MLTFVPVSSQGQLRGKMRHEANSSRSKKAKGQQQVKGKGVLKKDIEAARLSAKELEADLQAERAEAADSREARCLPISPSGQPKGILKLTSSYVRRS